MEMNIKKLKIVMPKMSIVIPINEKFLLELTVMIVAFLLKALLTSCIQHLNHKKLQLISNHLN